MYEQFKVYRISEGFRDELVGSVSAQNHEQAVYRLVGGAFGRTDFYASNAQDEYDAALACDNSAERAFGC